MLFSTFRIRKTFFKKFRLPKNFTFAAIFEGNPRKWLQK